MRLDELGVEVTGDTPEEFAAYIKREIPKWAAVIRAAGALAAASALIDRATGRGALQQHRDPHHGVSSRATAA